MTMGHRMKKHSYPLYYDEPYRTTLETNVVSVEGSKVILKETIFYPEGGGQGGDRGTVNSCAVLDTVKGDDEAIIHMVRDPAFKTGDRVTLNLDWNRRFHFMKNHTAQHAASGILFNRFGIGTVSVHLGDEVMTIEVDRDEVADSVGLELQSLVNRAIVEGHPVASKTTSHKDAEALGLRRSIKVDGDVRLIHIDEVDTIACGGLHVSNTREIGLFLYQGQERIRGHARLIFIVGETAWDRILLNRTIVDQLGTLYSSPPSSLVETVAKAHEVAASEKALLDQVRSRLASVLLDLKLSQETGPLPVITWELEDDITLKDLGQAASRIAELALCAIQRLEDGKLAWLIVLTGDGAKKLDIAKHRSELLSSINGKGGGKAPIFQGVGEGDPAELFARFRDLLK
jgi:alanyl-tRNA synthetase